MAQSPPHEYLRLSNYCLHVTDHSIRVSGIHRLKRTKRNRLLRHTLQCSSTDSPAFARSTTSLSGCLVEAIFPAKGEGRSDLRAPGSGSLRLEEVLLSESGLAAPSSRRSDADGAVPRQPERRAAIRYQASATASGVRLGSPADFDHTAV